MSAALKFLVPFYRTATARGKAEQSDIASMHAREDAQIAKECSLEYGANTASPTSPSNESNDMSKMNLSPTKQQGSIREYLEIKSKIVWFSLFYTYKSNNKKDRCVSFNFRKT